MNKTRTTWIIASASLFFCIFICASAVQFILHKCLWWDCAPQRNFKISDLALPSNLFPDGSIINPIFPLSDEHTTIEDGMQSIFWDNGNGSAGYTIYRYPTVKNAKDAFEFHKHELFNRETKEAWKPPTNLTFSSATADALYIACGYWNDKECAMVARYQEYVVFFNTTVDTKMTFPSFEKILIFIDQQISGKIYH